MCLGVGGLGLAGGWVSRVLSVGMAWGWEGSRFFSLGRAWGWVSSCASGYRWMAWGWLGDGLGMAWGWLGDGLGRFTFLEFRSGYIDGLGLAWGWVSHFDRAQF